MPAERLLPTTEAEDLLKLTREIARDELAPIASRYEEEERFPREQFRLLGRSGLLGLPYPEQWGGRAVHPGPALRRRLRGQRHQGLDHPRRPGRLLHHHDPHLRRPCPRHQLL